MSRQIPLDKINKMIDDKAEEYRNLANKLLPGSDGQNIARAEALEDFKVEVNDPENIVDVSENIDQSKAVQSAKNILKNE